MKSATGESFRVKSPRKNSCQFVFGPKIPCVGSDLPVRETKGTFYFVLKKQNVPFVLPGLGVQDQGFGEPATQRNSEPRLRQLAAVLCSV